MSEIEKFVQSINRFIWMIWIWIFCIIGSIILAKVDFKIDLESSSELKKKLPSSAKRVPSGNMGQVWQAPDTNSIPSTEEGDKIRYGRKLIEHTAVYLGPKGKVRSITNGMNCQNCHLKAGTLPFGNNYAAVASKYPVWRPRSGSIESFEKRVNDCIERSLNGQKLEENSLEMQSIVAYLKWVGKDVSKENPPKGLGLLALNPLDRPTDPQKGSLVYVNYCVRCHGQNGEGIKAENGYEWEYPPVFGENSYNIGAGLFRLSTFAAFIRSNMPYGITYENPFLTEDEAWDVAAYINSMPRPEKDISMDWPDISKKPFDHPYGPYADTFPENQHKYGPFKPIIASKDNIR